MSPIIRRRIGLRHYGILDCVLQSHHFLVPLQNIYTHMQKRGFISILTLIFSLVCLAQRGEDPVHWNIKAKMTSDSEGVVTVVASMDDGWHIYGLTGTSPDAVATSFDFSASKGVSFTTNIKPNAAPITTEYDTYWERKVTFTRHFKLAGSEPDICVTIRYVSCNGASCNPPKTITLKLNKSRIQ